VSLSIALLGGTDADLAEPMYDPFAIQACDVLLRTNFVAGLEAFRDDVHVGHRWTQSARAKPAPAERITAAAQGYGP
jgi:hypothetical protein